MVNDGDQEDWLRGATWDVTAADGSPVTDLAGLAEVLRTDRETAAGRVLAERFGVPAPSGLLQEARAAVRGAVRPDRAGRLPRPARR